jgi:RNA polymerase subunit RPABC4/transcription elongation factor Spt4
MKCPVCGKSEFAFANSHEICPVCNWQNDEGQHRDPEQGECANKMSLNEAREAYRSDKPVE